MLQGNLDLQLITVKGISEEMALRLKPEGLMELPMQRIKR